MEKEYTYDGKFEGNILVVGRTGCGKTTFIQKLGKNKLFGSEVTDVSKIVLSTEREDFIRESFVEQEVHFSYPHDLGNFNYLVENFTQDKSEYVDNELGENLLVNKLIIMDDVSGLAGLADKSQEFSNFLTVSRKYGFSCLYVFHTIYPGRQNCEMIMSQTHIFNLFPGSIHSSRILKTLSLFASRQKNTYLPNQQVWLNKLYFQISNSKDKKCLTIDTRDVNELGPGKFRTSANNREEQTCYFNRNRSDTYFTSFFAKRTQTNPITFSIVKPNSDFELVNKSLDFELNSSISNGQSKREHQQTNSRNFNNGRSKRSETTESANVRQRQQRGGILRRNSRDESAAARKKPRFFTSK